jgi:hypothetical protein
LLAKATPAGRGPEPRSIAPGNFIQRRLPPRAFSTSAAPAFYRAFRLNEYTTVLLHPYEDRPVGVKIKGVRFLYGRANAILKVLYPDNMKEKQHDIALAMLWEVALTATGERETAEAEAQRQKQLAERAKKEIVQQAGNVSTSEFEEAA